MVKVIEIKTAINELLESKHERVYYQSAPKDATFPYLVFDLPNSTDDGSLERFVLDIDAWDNKKDTTEIETLIDSIDKGLHRKTIVVNDLSMTFYRENRLALRDDDPSIRRRKYIYQIRTYE